jgi:hypothetical protein
VVEGETSSRNRRDIDSAFVPISERMPPDSGARIKVLIPGQKPTDDLTSPHAGKQKEYKKYSK